jgi:uridine kinase
VGLVQRLASVVAELSGAMDRVLVGIDGPDAAGKTTLADRLVDALPVPTVRASIDGFHQPRELRYRRGDLSADGYYLDSFDYPALVGECLEPFRQGAAQVRVGRYDHLADVERRVDAIGVPRRAVLVVDGVFLLRDLLRHWWTFTVYLRISPEETLRRALVRDAQRSATPEETERRYRGRYLPGQALYGREVQPEAVAHVVVNNEDMEAPTIERWAPPNPR